MAQAQCSPPSVASETLIAARQLAGQLLLDVFDEILTPRQGINRWPVVRGRDRSLDTAYQALLHFEADEKQQREIPFYMDAQLELIRQMGGQLVKGQELPVYMLAAYDEELREHWSGWYDEKVVLLTPWTRLARNLKGTWKLAQRVLKVF